MTLWVGAAAGLGFLGLAGVRAQQVAAENEPDDAVQGVVIKTTTPGSWTEQERMRIVRAGNVVIGTGALSKSSSHGFLYIPTVSEAPEGIPDDYPGRVPLVYDAANDRLYVYNGGWKSASFR